MLYWVLDGEKSSPAAFKRKLCALVKLTTLYPFSVESDTTGHSRVTAAEAPAEPTAVQPLTQVPGAYACRSSRRNQADNALAAPSAGTEDDAVAVGEAVPVLEREIEG